MSSKRKIRSLLNEYTTKISSLPFITKDGDNSIVENTYICPLCLQSFKVDELGDTVTDYLSLEDIPQKAMGGHPLLLTCKKCNNRCGHKIDHFLQTEIDYEDEVSIHSKDGVRGALMTKGITINTRIRKDDGIITFNILSSQNSPIELYRFNEEIEKLGENWQRGIKYQLEGKRRDPIRADIAILKSAYLLAFYVLGYKYILNSNLSSVREQILFPDREIISDYVINRGIGLPLEMSDGVYVAEYHKSRFLAVIISMKMKESEKMHRYVVALPYIGVDEDIYNKIKDASDDEGFISLLGYAKIKDWHVNPFPQKGRRYLVY